MAATIAKITFTDQPSPDDILRLVAQNNFDAFTSNRTETFKVSRINPGEVTIGSTVNETAQNYASAFQVDYINVGNNFVVTILDNIVTITVNLDGNFTGFTSFVTGDFATVELLSPTIIVSGIESDRYLINNEIWIDISSNNPSVRYDLVFLNTTSQKTSSTITVYPSPSGTARINLSDILKSLFQYPADADGYDLPTKNANKFKITISAVGNPTIELVRTFIRGGRRTNDTNQTLSGGQLCRPVGILPVWDGYETSDYYLSFDGQIIKGYPTFLPRQEKDFRRSKGCNEVYMKFMNQQGGYSNWLFESHSVTESNTPQGTFIRNNKLEDLGSDADSKLKIYSKVPKYYKALIDDLLVSPDVWAFDSETSEFVRVSVAKNSFESDNFKRSYSVNLSIDYSFRFKPSVLW